MKKNILVISPHADDEVIGCGGMIAMASDLGHKVIIVILATGGIKHCHLSTEATLKKRIAEIEKASELLGVASFEVLFPGKDMQLEGIARLDIVSKLDDVIGRETFHEFYIPEPSHNLDHKITYEASMAALRPGLSVSNKALIATYESTTANWFGCTPENGRYYLDISEKLNLKLNALKEYKSQIREYPHPVSTKAVSRLAAFRGAECGAESAELFIIKKLVK